MHNRDKKKVMWHPIEKPGTFSSLSQITLSCRCTMKTRFKIVDGKLKDEYRTVVL